MSGTDDKLVGVETVNSPAASNDLVKAVDKLLNEIGPKFTKVSAELFAKMDEMAQRLDDMEAAIKAGNDPATEGN
ncbi:hypothetical protein JMJ35_009661 [Cladonia borealis]|uniref:Heat shock factor binding protein 1 n=1 Tax=Cladonia borealis TaxID=184061 RepID=A0AA39QRE0_9LECA|nr:hypothetical protein JMJ35_009661 [Cladonia borealis]